MKNIEIIFVIFSLSPIVSSQTNWVQQNSGVTTTINDIRFVDSNTGYCVGNSGLILKTTNGGTNWFQQVSGSSSILYQIGFADANTGYLCGSNQVMKTTNGGNNWIILAGISRGFYISVFSSNNIFVADIQTCFKTTNGGLNWVQYPSINLSIPGAVRFISENTGWACGSDFGPYGYSYPAVTNTTNGGQSNWNVRYITPFFAPNSYCSDIHFFNTDTGYCACTYYTNYMVRFFNAGLTWDSVGTPVLFEKNFFTASNTGWGTNSGSLYRTTNSALSWNIQTIPTSSALYTIYFIDINTGWAAGSNGNIIKTTNGGITDVKPNSNNIPSKFALLQNYPNPFNPSTIIKYQVPRTSYVKLSVFDVLGREIEVLVNEKQSPGTYEVEFKGSNLTSGVYFYKLETDNFSETRKLVLLK